MGTPVFMADKIPTMFNTYTEEFIPYEYIIIDGIKLKLFAAGMGNPHMVIIVNSISNIPIDKWGGRLEVHPKFPNKTNVHFVELINKTTINVKTWERGCGPTQACGTGACAVLAVIAKQGLCENKSSIILPGGKLIINWPECKDSIFMTGPANFVFSGTVDI